MLSFAVLPLVGIVWQYPAGRVRVALAAFVAAAAAAAACALLGALLCAGCFSWQGSFGWVLRYVWRAWTIAHRHPSPGLPSIYCPFEIGARSITTLDPDLFPSVLMHLHVLGHIRVSHVILAM